MNSFCAGGGGWYGGGGLSYIDSVENGTTTPDVSEGDELMNNRTEGAMKIIFKP